MIKNIHVCVCVCVVKYIFKSLEGEITFILFKVTRGSSLQMSNVLSCPGLVQLKPPVARSRAAFSPLIASSVRLTWSCSTPRCCWSAIYDS